MSGVALKFTPALHRRHDTATSCSGAIAVAGAWVCEPAAAQQSLMGTTLIPVAATPSSPLGSDELEDYRLDGLSGQTVKEALSKIYGDRGSLSSRGKHDSEIYQVASPSVAIILTDTGMGSGVYIGANQIVTNRHVVNAFNMVGVIFKPPIEGSDPAKSSVARAQVIKVDAIKDLALVQVSSTPSNVHALEFGSGQDARVGEDVHAIGHPTGQAWTYTKGLISQIRLNYEWETETESHRANVIQTQTPINPGNSGGPLIADNG
jgi:S1-C subfamily serine protease